MELYIARHGETEANAERRFQGNGLDTPLTPKGIGQAKALGETIAGIEFDAIYASPLGRAMDTARIAFGDKALFERENVFTDPRLVEIGIGKAEGALYHEDARDSFSSLFKNLLANPMEYVPAENGEKLVDMITRLDSFLQELATKSYKRVFVMAHGYVLRVVYACSKNKTVADIGDAPIFDNCALARYKYDLELGRFIMYTDLCRRDT